MLDNRFRIMTEFDGKCSSLGRDFDDFGQLLLALKSDSKKLIIKWLGIFCATKIPNCWLAKV